MHLSVLVFVHRGEAQRCTPWKLKTQQLPGTPGPGVYEVQGFMKFMRNKLLRSYSS